MIRLYRAEWSTNCERVGLALGHKGLEAESVLIDYADRSPVEEVSGQGLVPVIDDAGRVVNDSRAILAYLEERYPDPPLFPTDPAARAGVDLFCDWFERVYKAAPNAIEEELERADPDEDLVERCAAEMRARLDLFERLLTGRDYLFVDFGAADCVAYPFLKYAAGRDPADDELFTASFKSISRWATAIPGWVRGSLASRSARGLTETRVPNSRRPTAERRGRSPGRR